jgi:glycosyltransferase involved in cell wall biosynthesis
MKVLFLTHYFPPESNAPANRTYEHLKEWVKLGDSVTVITNFPNHPMGVFYPHYRNAFRAEEIIDGIRVIRVLTYAAPNKGIFRRILNYTTFMFMAIVHSLTVEKPDVIIATSPQFFAAIAGYIISVMKSKPFVFELRDIWPASIKSVGAIRNNIFLSMLERLEIFLYRRANLVVSLTDSFVDYLCERGIDRSKVIVINNGVNLDLFHPFAEEERKKKREERGLDGKYIVSYIGTIGMAHGLSYLIDTAALLQSQKSIHFLVIGDGAEKDSIAKKVRSLGLKNVSILGLKPREEIPTYYGVSDAIVVQLIRDPMFTKVIPSKIFESMGMSKPILLSVDGEARRIVGEANCGLYSEPEDCTQLAENILRLKTDPQLESTLGTNGFVYVRKHFDRKTLAEKMRVAVRDMLSS